MIKKKRARQTSTSLLDYINNPDGPSPTRSTKIMPRYINGRISFAHNESVASVSGLPFRVLHRSGSFAYISCASATMSLRRRPFRSCNSTHANKPALRHSSFSDLFFIQEAIVANDVSTPFGFPRCVQKLPVLLMKPPSFSMRSFLASIADRVLC